MNLSPIDRFWKLLKKYRDEIREIYIYALFIGIVNLTLPLGIQAIVNFLQTGEFTSTWLLLVGFVLTGIAITGFLQVLQLRIVENIQQDIFARSGIEFAFRIPKIVFLQLDKIHAPELVNRFFDIVTIQKGLPKILIDFSLAIFQIFFGLILLTIYSPYFIILGVILTLILWLIFKFTGPKGVTTSLEESKYKYELAHWLEEVARTNRTFKLYGSNGFHLNRTDNIIQKYIKSRKEHFQVLISQFRLFVGFKVIVAAGLLLLGGFLVFQEIMNIGQFVAAEIIILLIINSIEKIIRFIDTIYDVLTALEKIGYVTDLEIDKDGGSAKMDKQDNGLSVRGESIEFSFPDMNRNVIDELTFEISSNDRVVLKGKSGSGKSILLQLIAGIHKIEEGEIYIDDIPLRNYSKDQYYKSLGFSFPVNQIFEGTIKENILIGREVSENDLADVVYNLKLNNFLNHKPHGIDSHIDSGGRSLPRSIIQKILIARLIITNPRLLLMEDPLQFIADEEKERIIDYIMSEERKWTVVVISDNKYWLKKANKVINLDRN